MRRSWPSPASTRTSITTGRSPGWPSAPRGSPPCTRARSRDDLAAESAGGPCRARPPGARHAAVAGRGRAGARRGARPATGIAPDTVVFGCFGGLTPDKRAAADPRRLRRDPGHACRRRVLLLGGEAAGALRPARRHRPAGLDGHVIATGYVERRGRSDRPDRGERRHAQPALADRPRALRPVAAEPRRGPLLHRLRRSRISPASRCSTPAAGRRATRRPSRWRWTCWTSADQLPRAMRRLAADRCAARADRRRRPARYWQREHSFESDARGLPAAAPAGRVAAGACVPRCRPAIS